MGEKNLFRFTTFFLYVNTEWPQSMQTYNIILVFAFYFILLKVHQMFLGMNVKIKSDTGLALESISETSIWHRLLLSRN